jgi:hypothetical protein
MNPQTGRFHTMDTFEGDQENPQSLHKYLYCAANPVNRTDPSGHDPSFTVAGFTATEYVYLNSRSMEGSAVAAFEARALSTLTFKIGAWAIIGTAVAGNVAMVLDALGPAPQQQYLQKYAYEPYFGKFGTCDRYATLFKQKNPGAAFVGMRLKENIPSSGLQDRIFPRSGALFNQGQPASINRFHVGAVLNNVVFDNNILGVPLPLWGEGYEVHSPYGGALTSVNQAVRENWMEMRIFSNSGPPTSPWNLPPKLQWNQGQVLPPF